MSRDIDQQIDDFTRQLLTDRLAQCSAPQQALFHRLYPDGVPEDQLLSAIDLCERTIQKHLAKS